MADKSGPNKQAKGASKASKRTAKQTPDPEEDQAEAQRRPGGNGKLTAEELEHFEALLLALRGKALGNVSFLTRDSLRPMPISDESTDGFDCEFALNMAGSVQELLHEIDDALKRIDDGTYGTCELTGKSVGKARLDALPYARYCVEAKAEQEGRPRRPVDLD